MLMITDHEGGASSLLVITRLRKYIFVPGLTPGIHVVLLCMVVLKVVNCIPLRLDCHSYEALTPFPAAFDAKRSSPADTLSFFTVKSGFTRAVTLRVLNPKA